MMTHMTTPKDDSSDEAIDEVVASILRPTQVRKTRKASEWCEALSVRLQPLSSRERITGVSHCRMCGKTLKVRKNGNGTVLGLPAHKSARG